MTETIVFKNVYMTYIDNNPYKYPSIETASILQGSTANSEVFTIDTGWHIIPNFLWRHACIPRQWNALVTQCEAYQVKSISGVLYNPIPITTNISLQRVSQFSAFNNCTYAMTYDDNKYETSWFEWNGLPQAHQLHLAQREGLTWRGQMNQQTGGGVDHYASRYQWPIYKWRYPNIQAPFRECWSQGKDEQYGVYDAGGNKDQIYNWVQKTPSGVFWDPFNCPDEIGELRAGKNSISFTWNVHSADEGKWFNLDWIAAHAPWTTDGPYMGMGRPWTLKKTNRMDPGLAATFGLALAGGKPSDGDLGTCNDYTIPNMFNMPIVPTKWFWIEMGKSIVDWTGENSTYNTDEPFWKKPDKYWPGTEREAYLYSPSQWFCKGIPLYAVDNNPIKTTTQVSFQITLTLEGRKRRSAYFAPTYGPVSGDQLYYINNTKGIFQPSVIRYKTAGMRRTWQNMNTRWKNQSTTTYKTHQIQTNPRMDNYYWSAQDQNSYQYNNMHGPTGIGDYEGHNRQVADLSKIGGIKVKWTRDTDSTEIIMEEEEGEKEEEQKVPERPQTPKRKHDSILKLMLTK